MARLKMAEIPKVVDRSRRGVVVRSHFTAELFMSDLLLDPGLVIAILINFYVLTITNLKEVIYAVALQGALLGLLYPVAHSGLVPDDAAHEH